MLSVGRYAQTEDRFKSNSYIEEDAMKHKKLLPQVISSTLVLLLLVACSTPQPNPTLTPTQIPTPTETPIPGGIVSGRIYLVDRDEPVRTTVKLIRNEDKSEIDSTVSDEDGYYSFLVEEPDTYVIDVSVMDLYNICDNFRTEWEARVFFTDDSGTITEELARSPLMTIMIGDEIMLDCELYCD